MVSGSAFGRISTAFFKGCLSQLHPSMLMLLILPFLIALVLWALSAWLFWDPLVLWLKDSWLLSSRFVAFLGSWLKPLGLSDLGHGLASFGALLLLFPLVIATAMIAIAVFAMPAVMRFLSTHHYPGVIRLGAFSLWANLLNAVISVAVFALGYLASLPLWLIPPLALLVPLLWWGWLTARIMRFDSLVEHASALERESLIVENRREYFVLGVLVSVLNYIPPLFLITPVLSALVFGHYSLARLAEYRTVRLDASPTLREQR
jgi:hypothetical protein